MEDQAALRCDSGSRPLSEAPPGFGHVGFILPFIAPGRGSLSPANIACLKLSAECLFLLDQIMSGHYKCQIWPCGAAFSNIWRPPVKHINHIFMSCKEKNNQADISGSVAVSVKYPVSRGAT